MIPLAPLAFISSIWTFFAQGGVFIVPLLLVSLGSVTVIILRARALREEVVLPQAVLDAVDQLEPGDAVTTLRSTLRAHPSALSAILHTLIRHRHWDKAEALEAVQTRARREVASLERGLVLLEICTGISPLLGLLGTLSGLVGIFGSIGDSGDPVAVARGIAEALNTTIVGLAVAVPSLIAHNYFQRKVEVMAIEMESVAGDLMAKCYQSESHTTAEE